MVHHPAYQGSILMLMKDGLGSLDTDSIKVIILTEEFISHDYISIRCVHLILFWQFFFQISRHADSTWMILAPSPPVCPSCRISYLGVSFHKQKLQRKLKKKIVELVILELVFTKNFALSGSPALITSALWTRGAWSLTKRSQWRYEKRKSW